MQRRRLTRFSALRARYDWARDGAAHVAATDDAGRGNGRHDNRDDDDVRNSGLRTGRRKIAQSNRKMADTNMATARNRMMSMGHKRSRERGLARRTKAKCRRQA